MYLTLFIELRYSHSEQIMCHYNYPIIYRPNYDLIFCWKCIENFLWLNVSTIFQFDLKIWIPINPSLFFLESIFIFDLITFKYLSSSTIDRITTGDFSILKFKIILVYWMEQNHTVLIVSAIKISWIKPTNCLFKFILNVS